MNVVYTKLLDNICEARRYAIRNPTYTSGMATDISATLIKVHLGNDGKEPAWRRLAENIEAARKLILVDPEVIQGYLWGAHLEIQSILAEREKMNAEIANIRGETQNVA